MTRRPVTVIGIGDDGIEGLSRQALRAIEEATVLYGGARQLAFFPNFKGCTREIRSPLRLTLDALQAEASSEAVVVLASGDPLFYGIGSTIAKTLGADHVMIIPSISSVQLACARAGLSWHDARIISLHGRPMQGLAQKLRGAALIALLTDADNTPSAIAQYLLHFNMTQFDVFVGEHLGGTEERTGWYTLAKVSDSTFATLNVVLLRNPKASEAPVFPLGIEDEAFVQRKPDRGLITKREIRVLSLSELALRPHDVLWDIGACTGSVSIEAILSTPDLRVYAVEKNEEDLQNLRDNQIRFQTDFVAVHAKAPDGLAEFPDPDAVFVGGSGGELSELLQLCADRLRPGGRIVVNAATIENLYQSQDTLRQLGFSVRVTLVQTARSKPILQLTRFEGMNPVYLVTGTRALREESTTDD